MTRQIIMATAICAVTLSATAATAATEILRQELRPNGAIVQIVRDDEGRVFKVHADAGIRESPVIPDTEEQSVTTFYEGFEDYTLELGLNWIPEGWREINTEANIPTEEQLSHNINNSWYVYFTSSMYQDPTTDGEKEAFIHFAYDGDYGVVNAAQDEWLITPEIQLSAQETLHFLLQSDFSEIYNFDYFSYSTYTYSKREIVNTMKVMISADGGDSWECLWDLADDEVSKLSDAEIMHNGGIYLRSYELRLDAYDNRKIQIAFRYMREEVWGGNSMIVDGVRITHPESAGIENITADCNPDTEYYNLQGLRISKPESGTICIRRRGVHAEKVHIK